MKDIETEGEISIYGTAEHNGALVLSVDEGSAAAALGLEPEDVIVVWGGREIRRSADLTALNPWEGDPRPLHVLRKQKKLAL